MRNNDQSNSIIKWMVIMGDFIILNVLLLLFFRLHPKMIVWDGGLKDVFFLVCNLALTLSEYKFCTVIHRRLISIGEVLRRIIYLTVIHLVLAYLLMKILDYSVSVGWKLFQIETAMALCLLVARFIERWMVKRYRMSGRNIRMVTFVGNDPELLNIYERLKSDPTLGYMMYGYYADEEIVDVPEHIDLKRLGTLKEFMDNLNTPQKLVLGDELYVSLSRKDRDTVKRISVMCDMQVIRFIYVPVSVETLGINLKREQIDDMEVFSLYENPLIRPINKLIKRVVDIFLSSMALLCIAPFVPIIALIIKRQSPGPIFFSQPRTGLDGKVFNCYKFRSMHVNNVSATVQAKKDDPRVFPFGGFMRKASVDELPQFWNVFIGDMSIVGPRPHPVALNDKYKQLIDKYMVRHFVKPGVTGWAQVTGYRGETEELWQMEGRVKRDIWYMEHWTIWLDIRVLWMTAKSLVIHDEHAY